MHVPLNLRRREPSNYLDLNLDPEKLSVTHGRDESISHIIKTTRSEPLDDPRASRLDQPLLAFITEISALMMEMLTT